MLGVQLPLKYFAILYLALIAIYFGNISNHCPADWLVSIDMKTMVVGVLNAFFMGIVGLLFVLWPVYLIAAFTVVLSLFFLPKKWSRSNLLLLMPLIPAVLILLWGNYCHIYLSDKIHIGSFENWYYKIFTDLLGLFYWHLAILTLPIICSSSFKSARVFGICSLVIQYCVMIGPIAISVMAVSKCWL